MPRKGTTSSGSGLPGRFRNSESVTFSIFTSLPLGGEPREGFPLSGRVSGNGYFGMNKYRAHDRLIGLSNNRDGKPTVYNSRVAYRCESCGTSTTFDIDLRTSWTALAEKFNRAMGTLKPYEQDYCDFDCSGCGVSVRCVYAISEVSMNQYQYYPETIYTCVFNDISANDLN